MRKLKIKVALGSVGNTEWWTAKDWEEHEKYCQQLKEEGKLGEVVEQTVMYESCPIFDKAISGGSVSSRMVILDLNKNHE